MTNKQKATRIAKRFGATIVVRDDEILAIAPDDFHWNDGCHEFVAWADFDESKDSLWKDLAERMAQGIFGCDDTCDN